MRLKSVMLLPAQLWELICLLARHVLVADSPVSTRLFPCTLAFIERVPTSQYSLDASSRIGSPCQQPVESSSGRGSRRQLIFWGKNCMICGFLAGLIGGPFQTLRTNGRTPREPLLNSRAKGVFQGDRMQCICCAYAPPRPSAQPILPGYHRLGRARPG